MSVMVIVVVPTVCGSHVITLINWTSVFGWYVTRVVVKDGHHKDPCYDESELCVQNR
jgi:hypothetical protein